ncbi:MAG: metallophosphoesterase family protein [Planctomycetes bacterium]|nr:metallophosphoesterase family protein [Planctomycetota bacterium]
MIAFISDLHANLPALTAVLRDIDSLGTVQRIYCLGDVIGYGPQPLECLDIAAKRCKLILMGNHEHAVLYGAYGFHPAAKRAIDWTRQVLQHVAPMAERKAVWQLLEGLPNRHEFDDVLLVHGSPRDPVMEYVLESDLWEGSDPTKIDEIFASFRRLCFIGHTHRPGIFTEDRCFLPAADVADGYNVADGARYLINVGSVGQPRDRDPRSCYTLFSGDAVYFRRVAYDIDATIAEFAKVPDLDSRLSERLSRGE